MARSGEDSPFPIPGRWQPPFFHAPFSPEPPCNNCYRSCPVPAATPASKKAPAANPLKRSACGSRWPFPIPMTSACPTWGKRSCTASSMPARTGGPNASWRRTGRAARSCAATGPRSAPWSPDCPSAGRTASPSPSPMSSATPMCCTCWIWAASRCVMRTGPTTFPPVR